MKSVEPKINKAQFARAVQEGYYDSRCSDPMILYSEIMDDFDAGKKFARNKVLELMDEVIEQYEGLSVWSEQENDMGSAEHTQAQLNAVKFMKSWVISGGHEDEDGNRVCLVR